MNRARLPLALLMAFALPASGSAESFAPEKASRPATRPGSEVSAPAVIAERPAAESGTAQPLSVPRPRARLRTEPAAALPAAASAAPAAPAPASPSAVAQAARPELRPALENARTVSAATVRTPPATQVSGALCGVPGLEGGRIAPVNGAGACGIDEPVQIKAVSGVRISPAAVMDCGTARALASWVDGAAKPALSATGGGLAVLRTAGSYVCRSRNSEKGAQLSEHAYGRAIDITALGLRDGREISVQSDWHSKGAGPALKALHKAACGPFGTVLGPDANAAHRDHFHFDTASGRSPYCR